MRPERVTNKLLFAAVVSLWVLIFFPYAHFYNLSEADFLCASPHLENPFSDGFLSSLQGKWDFMKGSDCPMIFPPEKGLSRFFLPGTFPILFSSEKPAPLRC